MRTASVLCVVGVTLLLGVSGAQAQVQSGNDTGGIIPWSCQAEPYAPRIAAGFCAQFHKYARITGVQRHPGDYISFACLWSPYVDPYAKPAVPVYYGGCAPSPGYFKSASAPPAAAPLAAASALPEPAPLASAPSAPAPRPHSPKSN